MSSKRFSEIETPDMSMNNVYYHSEMNERHSSPGLVTYDNNEAGSPDFVNGQSLPEFIQCFVDGSTHLPRDSLRNMLSTLDKPQLIELLSQAIVASTEVHQTVAYTVSTLATFRRLLVRNIAFSSTSEEVKDLLSSRYGMIEEGTVVYDRNTNKSKGFAFVTFASVDSACQAVSDSVKGLVDLNGRPLFLKFAADKVDNSAVSSGPPANSSRPWTVPLADLSPTSFESVRSPFVDPSKQSRKLFAYNLSPLTTNESLANVFALYGPLEECLVVLDTMGVSKRYGFVTFLSEESAWDALQDPNKTIDGQMTFTHLASEGPNKGTKRPLAYRPPFTVNNHNSSPVVVDDNHVDVLFNNIISGLLATDNDAVESLWNDSCSTPENIKTFL